MTKTHMLTLIVGALLGPVEAGVFYIALRVTELVSGVGGTASETAVAALADAPASPAKVHVFQHAWGFAALLTLHGVLLLGFAGERLLQLWLGNEWMAPAVLGWGMAIFGLEGVFSRMVVNSSMGLGLVRSGAKGNVAESILLVGMVYLFLQHGGLGAAFMAGGLGFLPLIPVAMQICRRMEAGWISCWLLPIREALPSLGINLLLLAATPFVPLWAFCGLVLLSGFVALWGLKKMRSAEPAP
jgi:O-antigen/teichoic acid export membrane protein